MSQLYPNLSLCRRMWETKILKTLASRPNNSTEYILLRSHQVNQLPICSQIPHSNLSCLACWNCFDGVRPERTHICDTKCRGSFSQGQYADTYTCELISIYCFQTGLRGMAGNKGAVGIRLEYYDTNFCFVTAHLAAGHSNIEERNMDYRTIANGLHFLRGKTIDSHQ